MRLASLRIKEGDQIELLGRTFTTIAVLPETGTVDDSRIFAHLHTVQDMTGKGPVFNAIEIVGCCSQINAGLVQKINKLLPDAKVVTITQVVDTQLRTNKTMAKLLDGLSGHHHSRGWREHCQLHVRQRL